MGMGLSQRALPRTLSSSPLPYGRLRLLQTVRMDCDSANHALASYHADPPAFRRCRIEMCFGDHAPPHFHAITRDNERVAVLIETLEIRAGTAEKRDIAEALKWAKAHRVELSERWNEFSETE